MGNSLVIYLNKRMQEEAASNKYPATTAGPVITISREVGCNGLKLAQLISNSLNKKNIVPEWKVLSKEIFYESARELDLDPERIQRIFKHSNKYIFEEILHAFKEKQYKSELRITNTVAGVVRSFAIDGFCIIVGRAGHLLAKDIKNALHLRLVAPLDYRIKVIMENNGLSADAAKEFIQRIEKERIAFRNAILPKYQTNEIFDLTLNRAAFSEEQIVCIIESAAKEKGLLKQNKHKLEYF